MDSHVVDTGRDLEVVPLDSSSWRVSDIGFESSDAPSVLAYVERRRNGRYSVLALAPRPGAHVDAGCMEEALQFIRAQRESVNPRVPREERTR